jgi:hypothetical protein
VSRARYGVDVGVAGFIVVDRQHGTIVYFTLAEQVELDIAPEELHRGTYFRSQRLALRVADSLSKAAIAA